MSDYNMTYSNMVNSIIIQVFLVVCIVLFLLIRSEPRVAFVPASLMSVLKGTTSKSPAPSTSTE
jgi:hypothetical protein